MITFGRNCPHCGTEKVDLKLKPIMKIKNIKTNQYFLSLQLVIPAIVVSLGILDFAMI